jgi:outer membrane protein assembly factor BamB/tRNA A-37 threonylcarbamoyl transferase component Bud32
MPLLKKRLQPDDAGSPPTGTERLTESTVQQVPATHETQLSSTSTQTPLRRNHESPGSVNSLSPGTVLQERYVIEDQVGVGGMSTVYRGRDLRFKDVVRNCAIKEMYQFAPDTQTRDLRLKNFEREASLLATLSHPAIPKVYDFFAERNKIYLVMELIAGQDLSATLDRAGGAIEEARVGRWALQICDVLKYLHTHTPDPIIFRDLKPSNIIVTPEGRIVLIDFGIARLFQIDQPRGTIVGTEGYAPPEQYRGVGDERVDIYALGATLHHLLTGVDPRNETPFTFHERPVRQLNPAVSSAMEAIVMRALSYDASARPASIAEMRALLQTVPGMGTPVPPSPSTVKLRSSTTGAKTLWKFACGDEVRSSPAIRDDLLYIGSYDKQLYCFDTSSGNVRWKWSTDGGVSSSPAVWDNLVVAGSEDGMIYGLDAQKGALRWSVRTGRPVRSSPKIADRIVYVGSDDQQVYAIDGMQGRQLWQYRTWMPVRSSCAVGDGSIYVGSSDSHVYALDALSGNLRWKQRTQNGIISTPAFDSGLVFVGSMDAMIYALDTEGGWVVWRYKTGHYVNASPVVTGTRVIVAGVDGNVYAFDMRSGKLAWKYEAGVQFTSSPRVSDGFIYVGGTDGALYKIEAASGMLVWKQAVGGPLVSSPAIAGGVVYIGSLDHHVYALEA